MAPTTATPTDVVTAFFSVANKLNSRLYHSKWIPLEYWAFLVNRELRENKIQTHQLKKFLEPFTHRMLSGDDKGDIVWIKHTWKKLKRRRISEVKEGQKKLRDFYRVETSATLETNTDETENQPQDKQIRMFQQYYFKYRAKIKERKNDNNEQEERATTKTEEPTTTPAASPPSETATTTPAASPPSAETATRNHTASLQIDTIIVTSLPEPVNTTIPRPVTPTTNALDSPANADIKAILESVINPELLTRQDLFVGDEEEACKKLRDAMHKFGKQKQKESNELHYQILTPDDRLADQVDGNKYTKLLDRFCCPLNKRAIQGFLTIALQMAQENNATKILALPRKGGIGYGKHLVPVIPSSTRKTLHDNALRWLPTLYEAVAANDTMDLYTICFQMIVLHKHHCPKAFDDACRTRGPVAKAFKIDPHRQIAMCIQANLTYSHL